MHNFFEPMSESLFHPARMYVPLFVHFLPFSTDIKIEEFKTNNIKVDTFNQSIEHVLTRGQIGLLFDSFLTIIFNDILWSGAVYAIEFH